MEHVCARDDSPSPHPTGNPATPLIQADPAFLLTPNRRDLDTEHPASRSPSSSTENLHYADKSGISSSQSLRPKPADLRFEPPRPRPLIRGFERPRFSRVAILSVLCLITYPVIHILTLVAKDKSLFVVRAIVSVWCSGVGFALGYILLKIGAQHLEAATWATVIHMSHKRGGMKLRELARSSSNPTSFMPAFHIFRSRFGNRGTPRRLRESYDKRPWSLFLAFFVVLTILAPMLPFLFGRIVVIETFISNQRKAYHEVLIAGDLSKEDQDRAYALPTKWTAFPYGGSTSDTAEFAYGNDTVYFAQPIQSQFLPGGSGVGTFNPVSSLLDGPQNNTLGLMGRNTPKSDTGVILRYPQWGLRVHCEKLPNPEVNLIPKSSANYTLAFIPRDFLRGLFGTYGMELPEWFVSMDLGNLAVNDTIPSHIDTTTMSALASAPDDTNSVSLLRATSSANGQEWTAIETILIRFGDMPSGRFPVSFYDDEIRANVGCDAAVCLLKYEPWIIEAYNTSFAPPSLLRIVEKGSSLLPIGNIRGAPLGNNRNLNTTGKTIEYWSSENNVIYQMLRVNDGGYHYKPTPTAISFIGGAGPQGFSELNADRFATIRGRVGAANSLPYLAGSAPVVAQSYADETLAYVTYEPWQLIGLPVLILILGIIGELFVPTLPLDVPRREFGIYSWLALFQSQARGELRFEGSDDLDMFMSLDELEEKFSDKRVGFSDLDFPDHRTAADPPVTPSQ